MKTELTMVVIHYQKLLHMLDQDKQLHCLTLYSKILHECYIIIYNYPVQIHLLDEEEAADLLLSMKPRLKHIIDTFTYSGISFENFIRRISYMQAKIHKKRVRKDKRKYVCIPLPSENFDQLTTAEYSVPYGNCTAESVGHEVSTWSMETELSCSIKKRIAESKTFRKRFLQLVLLCSEELNAHHIRILATCLGMTELSLARKISRAYEKSQEKRIRAEKLMQIKDHHYMEKHFYQRELSMLLGYNAHPIELEKVRKRLEREEKLFLERRDQVRKRSNSITHDVVGELTITPKGTVDSGLSALKRTLLKMIDGYS